ncbi:MAG: hypothetical protein EOQ95_09260 [Mesorhizobium sp.]|nr:MAG: hypothetical protein EOQ95_09260 [Mesorhizobium sp.]RWQ48497.1 MAG: hypothetical protein EOS84_26435 [Mesorhizobium sp.]
MRGAPAWHRQHSVQHPSSVLALRANPPSPTRGEGEGSAQAARTSRIELSRMSNASFMTPSWMVIGARKRTTLP